MTAEWSGFGWVAMLCPGLAFLVGLQPDKPLHAMYARLRTLSLVLWAGLCLASAGGRAHASEPVDESDLKAAYVFNFIQFIEWPETDQAEQTDWTVCILPFSPLRRALTALQGRPARKGRPISVRLVESGTLDDCQVLMLHASTPETLLRALRALPPQHGVLTVADGPMLPPANADVMIALVPQAGRVGFTINTDATTRAGLTVSSRLLRLAKAGK